MRSTRQAKEADAEKKSRSNPVQKMEVHAGESDGGRGQADARRADSEGQREGEQQLLPTAREKLLRRFGGGAADAPNTRQSLQRQLAGKRSASAPISLQAKYADGGERACRAASGGPVGERAASALGRAERDPGAPLDEKVRSRAEGALGVDLGGVRVHTGAASQDAAASVRARAYTVGQDIHFGAGHYRPGSAEGERLIAHEVVHTVQQRGSAGVSAQPSLEVSTPGDHHEHEADSLASQITGPRNKPSVSAPGDSIGRPTALPVTRVARQVQLTPLSDAEAEYNKSKDKEQFIQAFEKHYAPVTLVDHNSWKYDEVQQLWSDVEPLPKEDVLTTNKITKKIVAEYFSTTSEYKNEVGKDVPPGVGFAGPHIEGQQEQMVGLGFDPNKQIPSAALHEVGHTVDYSNGIMRSHMSDSAFGSWRLEGTDQELDQKLSTMPQKERAELKQHGEDEGPNWEGTAIGKHTHGGRVYIRSYKDGWGWTLHDKWYSYDPAARGQINSTYAFRSPIEWFAEAYQHYYTNVTPNDALLTQGKTRHGGGDLRQTNAQAAAKIDDIPLGQAPPKTSGKAPDKGNGQQSSPQPSTNQQGNHKGNQQGQKPPAPQKKGFWAFLDWLVGG